MKSFELQTLPKYTYPSIASTYIRIVTEHDISRV